jgi:long-chain-fatty-acyl-CoA reductase
VIGDGSRGAHAKAPPTAPGSRLLRLPMVLDGNVIRDDAEVTEVVSPTTGRRAVVPHLTSARAEVLLAADRSLLVDIDLEEIISFIDRVGRAWRNPEYTRRKIYAEQLRGYLGWSEAMASTEADWISVILTSYARLYDMVAVELGSRFILDEWLPREETRVRAFPRGLSVHVLPGNVPLSAAVSLVRSLVTKNLCVLKASSQDPITPLALALSFHDIEADHPVTAAISAVYWDHDAPEGRAVIGAADAVCAWGGEEALANVHAQMDPCASFIPFGPRRSLAVVGAQADAQVAAERIAHDVCRYDQAACFSVREVFVERPIAEPFVAALTVALGEMDDLLPPGVHTLDQSANVTLAQLEEEWMGAAVLAAGDGAWAIIETSEPVCDEHPLGRVVWVRPVDSATEVLSAVDRTVQTVAVTPHELTEELRDGLAVSGVDRIVDAGMVNVLRPGAPHDGIDPLRQLVRLVGVENPARVRGKGMPTAIDQVAVLRRGRITEFLL